MHEYYASPLAERYASPEMLKIFSNATKFQTWRRLWVALAESEQELGLMVSDEQIAELKENVNDINYELAETKEKAVKHDVMAHIFAYGEQCPKARPILHLGATSSFVVDNTDLMQMKMGLLRIRELMLHTMQALTVFAEQNKGLPTLAYTHFQPAQPTTVGKRTALWLWDLVLDFQQLEYQLQNLKLLGCKGTTGTGASFLTLFHGDHEKVKALEMKIAEKMGFEAVYPVSGQTYSRKIDYQVLSVLSGIAQSAMKFSNDIRLLSHLGEVDEPFADQQIGSSAMAYKRNPMRSERMAALARYVILDANNPAFTAAQQWLERTLDDSANKRISIPEAFLAVDGILALYLNVIEELKVYPFLMAKHLSEELPFMATEAILMLAVERGGDRQVLHEVIRQHALAAREQVKQGEENDLLVRILGDSRFALDEADIQGLLAAHQYTGRAEEQTEEFLRDTVRPILEANPLISEMKARIEV